MDRWLRAEAQALAGSGRTAVLVTVAETQGSAPREAGTRMVVTPAAALGTIGGGHLELKAIDEARQMLAGGDLTPRSRRYPLGPALGQCCGGTVSLRFTALDDAALADWPWALPRFHLQLYGAGHVGRAIARALAPLNVLVDWIDDREDEFPRRFHAGLVAGAAAARVDHVEAHHQAVDPAWPDHIRKVCVDAVEAEVRLAPPGAFYLVLTHRHDLDMRITEAILERGDFGFLGLIGSKTKRQRFIRRFEQRGIPRLSIARMTCPIGLPGIEGKEPEVIAAAVVAQLLMVAPTRPAIAPAPCLDAARNPL